MTNFEKYRDDVIALIQNYDGLPALVKGKPHYCMIDVCRRCDLHGRDDHCCPKGFVEWLYKEYVEVLKLTKREHLLCEAIAHGWIARDADGDLYYYEEKPYKVSITLCDYWDTKNYNGRTCNLGEIGFQEALHFIKWEDAEPWSIEKLLKLEVEE